jgi:hypothetical protein
MKDWTNLTLADVERIKELEKIEESILAKPQIYKLLTSKTDDEVNNMNLAEMLKDYAKVTEFMLTPPALVSLEKIKVKNHNFYPLLDFKEWETWRMISYHNTIKSQPTNLALQCALLVTETKGKPEKLSNSQLEEREDLFRNHLGYSQINALAVFFWTLFNCWLAATQEYLANQKNQTKTNQTNKTSDNIGGGTPHSMPSQETTET